MKRKKFKIGNIIFIKTGKYKKLQGTIIRLNNQKKKAIITKFIKINNNIKNFNEKKLLQPKKYWFSLSNLKY